MIQQPEKRAEPLTPLGQRLRAIWDHIHTWKPPATRRGFGIYTETRPLTAKEWDEVQSAIRGGFPATIEPHGWISGIALVVYEPKPVLYPGVEQDSVPVCLVAATQVPGNDPRADRQKQKYEPGVERPSGSGVWEMFNEICKTPSNLEALSKDGLEAPKSIGHYQY